MIYCFLIDCNPSMSIINDSISSLDMSKCAIEQFILKLKGNNNFNNFERSLMLLKSGIDSSCLLSTLGDSFNNFEKTMKNLNVSNVNHNLSYSLTLALTLLNKYRMKSGVDQFGKGWMPWHLEPVTLIILTNGLSAIRDKDVPLLRDESGGDLYNSCLRWDHRVITYVVNGGKNFDQFFNTSLAKLCQSSGGETHICSTAKQSIYDLTARYSSIPNPQTITLDISILGLPQAQSISGLVGTLSITHVGEWPIPEVQWIDRTVDTLLKRPSRPHLQIISRDNIDPLIPSFTSEQLQSMITIARNCGLQPDVYNFSIICVGDKKRSLKLHYIKPSNLNTNDINSNSNNNNENENEIQSTSNNANNSNSNHENNEEEQEQEDMKVILDKLKDGCIGQKYCSVRLSFDSKDVHNPAVFAILCPSNDGRRSELAIFPYNFPQLLPLLQQARDLCNKIGGPANLAMGGNSPNSLPQTWQHQMGLYLRTVPPYYFPSMYKTFKSLGLHVYFSILIGSATSSPPPPDISLSRPCMRQLTQVAQKAKADLCLIDPTEALVDNTIPLISSPVSNIISTINGKKVDSSLIEYNTTIHRGPMSIQRSLHWKNPSSLVALGITSSNNIQNQNPPITFYHPIIPHMYGVPPSSNDLLYTWEKLRSSIYGGTGLTVRGIFAAGLNGSTSGSYINKNAQHEPDWFFKACGGARVPRLAIPCMSDYVSILSKKEALRDPESINPSPDEDHPQGILKRKLSVHFGSPYKLLKKTHQKHNKTLLSDEPSLPSTFEYRDGITVTDDIFSLPSPDQSPTPTQDVALAGEALIAFSIPSSPLILGELSQPLKLEDNSKNNITSLSTIKSEGINGEPYIIPKLKLKGNKITKIPPTPKQTLKNPVSLPLSQITQLKSSNNLNDIENITLNSSISLTSSPSLIPSTSPSLPSSSSTKNSTTTTTGTTGIAGIAGIALNNSSSFIAPWIIPNENTSPTLSTSQNTSPSISSSISSNSNSTSNVTRSSNINSQSNNNNNNSINNSVNRNNSSQQQIPLQLLQSSQSLVQNQVQAQNNSNLISSSSSSSTTTTTITSQLQPQLPLGWIKQFSEKHKCDYWFNTITGESQWTPPSNESITL